MESMHEKNLNSYGLHVVSSMFPEYDEKMGGVTPSTFIDWINLQHRNPFDTETIVSFRSSLGNLSSRAKEIVNLVFDTPPDYISFIYSMGKKRPSNFMNHWNIKKYLIGIKGWKGTEVDKAYKEIKNILYR